MNKENSKNNSMDTITEEIKAILEELGVDISELLEVPDGLDRFLVDDNFLEGYYKELKANNFDRSVYDRAKARLTLFPDRGKLARKTRIYLENTGKEGQIDTQREYIEARTECPESTEQAYAGYVVALKRLGIRMVHLVCHMHAEHKREMEELKDRIRQLEEQQGQALLASLSHPQAAPAKPRHKTRPADEEEHSEEQGQETVGGLQGFLQYRAEAFSDYIGQETDRMEFVTGIHAAEELDAAVAFADSFADGKRLKREALRNPDFQRRFQASLHPDCKNCSHTNIAKKLNKLFDK